MGPNINSIEKARPPVSGLTGEDLGSHHFHRCNKKQEKQTEKSTTLLRSIRTEVTGKIADPKIGETGGYRES